MYPFLDGRSESAYGELARLLQLLLCFRHDVITPFTLLNLIPSQSQRHVERV